ncbi:hypothetical protein [Rothia amarae]
MTINRRNLVKAPHGLRLQSWPPRLYRLMRRRRPATVASPW